MIQYSNCAEPQKMLLARSVLERKRKKDKLKKRRGKQLEQLYQHPKNYL